MGVNKREDFSCGRCGTLVQTELVTGINAGRKPALQAAILSDSLQTAHCKNCGTHLRAEPSFPYMDFTKKLWIAAWPAEKMFEWPQFESRSRDSFEQSLGNRAEGPAQDLGAGMIARMTFGWPALREKVLAADLAINDVDLELTKAALIRDAKEGAPVEYAALRLVAMQDHELVFHWFDIETQQALDIEMGIDRAILDDIRDHAESWAELRSDIDQGMYIDLLRLFLKL